MVGPHCSPCCCCCCLLHLQVVPDNYLYARAALIVKDKSQLSEEQLPALTEVLGEEAKAQEVGEGWGGGWMTIWGVRGGGLMKTAQLLLFRLLGTLFVFLRCSTLFLSF